MINVITQKSLKLLYFQKFEGKESFVSLQANVPFISATLA